MEANQTTDPTGYTPTTALDTQPPGGYTQPEVRLKAFRAALTGVDLGSYDIRIISFLVGWDDATCRTAVSLLWRARQAGEAAALGSAREHLASLAGHIDRRLENENEDRQAIAEDTAAHLRILADGAKPDGGLEDAARQVLAAWSSGDADWDSTGPGSLTAAVRGLRTALGDGGALRPAPGVAGETAATASPAQISSSPGEDGEDEPYCTVCGAGVGIFQGHGDGWHHYRGDGTAGHPVELYDAGHAATVAWRPVEGGATS